MPLSWQVVYELKQIVVLVLTDCFDDSVDDFEREARTISIEPSYVSLRVCETSVLKELAIRYSFVRINCASEQRGDFLVL